MAVNNHLSTHKSDSGLHIVLHPLPLLEISDFITRGYQRDFKGAIVGALLGQQHGREITIEYSFTLKSNKSEDGTYQLDELFFSSRLEQMKQVHKDPALDLVGWYSLVPNSGPNKLHVPIHDKILCRNDSAVLLGFHAEDVINPGAGDPLPITIYEGNMEAVEGAGGEDAEMKDVSAPAAPRQKLKFRELPYTVDSGEAEMIAMQFIREGAATASLDSAEKHIVEQFEAKIAVDDGKGKRRAVAPTLPIRTSKQPHSNGNSLDKNAKLTKAEVEYMSALQNKYNAIKMMRSRIGLVIAYLESLHPGGATSHPSNRILRLVQALVTNVELASPEQDAALQEEMLQGVIDVGLIKLIASLVTSVNDVRETGKKFSTVESMKNSKGRGHVDMGPGGDNYGQSLML
ncbi:complex subunit 6-like protein [Schizothecium vesticola]|uniref:COP9 signalosome complex subunit 6 n=1 Tax=Schizothecium vesticola TaxID=314040 RepID=A0AA40K9N2_9PEZI|nr:complex subunit 6-like protein [Schizothecium vesticola]